MAASLLEPGWTEGRRQVGDLSLHVVEAGSRDGPLAILLHGFPDFWWTWRHLIGVLAEAGFHVVAPDGRGYNTSDKPRGVAAYRLDRLVDDVVALADSYGAVTFDLVGHDWGGVVAWGVALDHPARVRRLVVMDAPHPRAWIGPAMRHPEQLIRSSYVAFFQLPGLPEAALSAGHFLLLRRALLRSSRSGTFSRADLQRHQETWRQPGALTGMLNYYRALRLPRPDGTDRSMDVPALVIWGGQDAFLTRPIYDASLALCQNGRGLFLDKASHWVHLEEAATVNAAVLAFLDAARETSPR